MKNFSKDIVEKAYTLAVQASLKAHAPYFYYKVGACLKVKGERLFYSGCNIENASYGAAICAERVALSKVVSEGYKDFDFLMLVVNGDSDIVPCGLCLQMLSEFFLPQTLVYCAHLKGIQKQMPFKEILPYSFRL